MKVFVFLATAALCAGSLSAQQVYKWVDQDGTVHFTDSPPDESVNAERMRLQGNVTTAINEDDTRGMQPDEIDSLYSPEQRRIACEQARANRTTLQTMSVIRMDLDGDGETEELTEAQKAAELRRAEQQVALLCRDED